jgi:hypothetical protein
MLLGNCWLLLRQKRNMPWGVAFPAETVLEHQQRRQQQLPPVPRAVSDRPVQDVLPHLLVQLLPAQSRPWWAMYGAVVRKLLKLCRAQTRVDLAHLHDDAEGWLMHGPEVLVCFLTATLEGQDLLGTAWKLWG